MRITKSTFPILFWLVCWAVFSGCTSQTVLHTPSPMEPVTLPSTHGSLSPTRTVQTPTAIPTATATAEPTRSPSASLLPTLTTTLPPTPTVTPLPQPTYAILRGEVNVEHVMCFYGPSKAYLYKYGLLGGSNLEILGIMEDTNYIQVRAIGGDNPCWMNLEWMNVKGDIASLQPLEPLDVVLPMSPYYGPLSSVSAVRQDNQVTISWSPLALRAGDDSEQEPYLVEAWLCQADRLTFVPVGLYETTLTLQDEPGCEEPSHGRVYGVEKHGYTRYIEIPWPEAR